MTTLGRLSVVFLVGVFAIHRLGPGRGGHALRPERRVRHVARRRRAAGQLGPGARHGMSLAIFSYLGYYNVCYLGAEVRDPARTIPRSILLSALIVVVLFTLVHLAIVGVVPWREAAQETEQPDGRVHGPAARAVGPRPGDAAADRELLRLVLLGHARLFARAVRGGDRRGTSSAGSRRSTRGCTSRTGPCC